MKLFENKYITITVPETIIRALDVAAAANKLLLIITAEYEILSHLSAAGVVNVVKPCPCGYFGSDLKKCSCEVEDIEKHCNSIRTKYLDCIRVDGVFSYTRQVKYKDLDGPSAMLLKQATQEFRFTVAEIVTMLDIAVGIAKLDKSKAIKPEHIAEAISYRMRC